MNIAVVIVNYRTPQLVQSCLRRLLGERASLPDLRVIVVDNHSADDSVNVLEASLASPDFADWVAFMPLSLNGGFGWGNNQAILHLLQSPNPPEAILLLNPDTEVEPGAISALALAMKRRSDAGAIGSQLINIDGSLAGSAFRFPSVGREFLRGCGIAAVGRFLGISPMLVDYGETGPVDWVTGASVLIRTQALRDAGLFDTGFFLYFEEVELMHRLSQKGWKTYHCPESRVMHVEAASTGVSFAADDDDAVLPRYIFASRGRYFMLTRGRATAFAAAISWLAGTFFGHALRTISGKRFSRAIILERRAFLAGAYQDYCRTQASAVTRVEDRPLTPPSWMAS